MSLAKRFIIMAMCAACFASFAHAQQQQQQPALQNQGATQTPKKANARPVLDAMTPKAEPFDKASVEVMSAQCVKLETEAGAIEVEMLAAAAPESARNFLNLAATRAYDTTTFSRIVKGFIIQGGNLTTRATLPPELIRRMTRTVPDEPNAVKHVRGILSMARSDEPNSATTHFFILAGNASHLDGTFAAFARVRTGMDVVDKINTAEVEGEKPVKPVHLTRATIAPCAPLPTTTTTAPAVTATPQPATNPPR